MEKPAINEYGPFHKTYIELVGEGEYFTLLKENTGEIIHVFGNLTPEKQEFRYDINKWTMKQMLMHLIDTERVMAYRALVLGRGDLECVLPNMDQDLFAAGVNVDNRTIKDLLDEFVVVRQSSTFLLQNLTEEQLMNTGNMFGYPLTPRALAYIILGHTMHHLKVINEKYLSVI